MKKINVKVKKGAEDKFRLLSDELVSMRISRDFEIELENGDVIAINKWLYESNDGSDDIGWEITEGRKIYDKMSEEEQDQFYDFVLDLIVIK